MEGVRVVYRYRFVLTAVYYAFCAFSSAGSLFAGDKLVIGNVVLERDVEYGQVDGHELTLDIIRPADMEGPPLPVVVYIHGGGWRAGDKSDGFGSIYPLAESGKYFAVSINYRLSAQPAWPGQIHDCKAAIRWLRSKAEERNIDANRIGVWGPSAGGHLASIIATSSQVRELEGECGSPNHESDVACCVAFCGPSDIVTLAESTAIEDHLTRILGASSAESRELLKLASPVTHVTPDDPPFLIMHGTADPMVSIKQAEILHDALRQAEVDSTFVKIVNGGHVFNCPEVTNRVTAFFDKHLRDKNVRVSECPIEEPWAVAVELLAKLAGNWQTGPWTVSWQWAVDRKCLTGSVTAANDAELGVSIVGYDPTTKGIVIQQLSPGFGNRTTRFTLLRDKHWNGESKFTSYDGATETSNAVLSWSGPDEFRIHYSNRILDGKLPLPDSDVEVVRVPRPKRAGAKN
jgi:acetyl esterase/lipase